MQYQHKKIVDAGGSSAMIDRMIHANHLTDIQDAIKMAKQTGKKINIGGRRHSMSGQTLFN